MDLGLYTFGDLPVGVRGPQAAQQRLREIVAAARLADQAGLAVFGIGEHHRPDYAISSPDVVLGALAASTKTIRLTTAVTILSSDDPVRVFEDYATLDLLSDGRAEIMVGRGAFIESFPLFGYDLNDYEDLYEEKLDLLLALAEAERVTWKGRLRPNLYDAPVSPRPLPPSRPPFWIAAGGTPASAVRAGRAGLPLNLAKIGGQAERFAPFFQLYRDSARQAGHDVATLPTAVSGHLHVAEDSQKARDEFYPYYARYMGHNLPQGDRGWKVSPADYAQITGPQGALYVGSPQEIIDKIGREFELFGHRRFMAQIDIGGLPYDQVARGIELLAERVMPALHAME